MSKEINARVLLKYDTAENWAQATFIPKRGEMIIYAPEGDTPVHYKIGDGTTAIGTLPFVATAGEPGANGIGIASITQTTTSTEDDGNNIVTVTLTNGDTSTFTVQNGSKGGKGDPGAPGTAATIEVGSVTTGAAGSSASVTNSGTAQAAKLNFTIPKGEKGDPGDDGIASVTTTGSGDVITGLSYNESTKVLTATKGSPALPNPKALTVGSKTYDGSSEVSITASDLGLSAAMKFIGTSQVSIEDSDVTNPITVDGKTVTATNGNVAIYGAKEFIWNGSAWEEFGNEGNYKVKQQANSKTATATQTIKSISQNENGNVAVETQDIAFPVTSVNNQTGAVTIDVPTALADLTADSTHRTVTDDEKAVWSAKSNFSGNYNDLINKPTIPTVNNTTLTIQKNGTNVATFTANSSTNATANITVPTKVSELTNDSGFITGIPVDSALSTSSTNPVQNKVVTTELNKKMGDFSIEIYNGTGGNPKPVRFASFNYSTCVSEEGIAAKISLVSGHGNGTAYAFLEDAIFRVNYLGQVSVDTFKYYGTDTGTYDGAQHQYGDIFWLHDTTNKIVDFYVLMGQYARVQQTPWKRLTYSSKGTVTQYTNCTVYSSGDKVWANNSEFATLNDIPAVPTKTSQLTNDSGFLTEHQSLEEYAKKTEVPTKTENWTFTLEDGSTVTKAVYVK